MIAPVALASVLSVQVAVERVCAERPGLCNQDLALVATRERPGGALHVFERRSGGRRILGGRVAIRTRGPRVAWIAGRDLLPLPAPGPTLDRAAAEAAAGGSGRAELVWDAAPGRAPRAVWIVDRLDFERTRVVVDARDGSVLRAAPRLRSARARVFATSPAVDDGPTGVDLPGLPPGATTMENARLRVETCRDLDACPEILPGIELHGCVPMATATADASGDFLAYEYPGDTDPDDAFAEVQAYYHLERTFTRLDELGFGDLDAVPLQVVVNYKAFDPTSQADCSDGSYDGGTALGPINNAFFAPGGELVGRSLGDTLAFGQGNAVDYAYDLDVVAHELGHAVLARLAPDLARGFVDRHGHNPGPDALHEAFPDLLALAVTGDPVLGEYVGSGIGDGSPLRDLSQRRVCPDQLQGSAHNDSRILASAWASARADVGPGLDGVALTTLAALDAYADLGAAATLAIEETRASLGDDAAAALESALSRSGLPGCRGYAIEGRADRYAIASDGSQPPRAVPAMLQHALELDDDAAAIELFVELVDTPVAAGDIDLRVVLRSGGAIEWSEEDGRYVADVDAEQVLAVAADGSARARFEGPFAPGAYRLQIVSYETPGAAVGAVAIAEPSPGDPGGCGCHGGPDDRGGGAALLALITALAVNRRRFTV